MLCPIVVLEGLDACGKSTQTELLMKNLETRGLSVGFIRFPGYDRTAAGKRIAAYLRGEFGEMKTIDPRIVACLFAADRLEQIEDIGKLRDKHDVLICDRGVTSNLIYTPARGEKKSEIAALEKFVEMLEYEINGFPRESLVIFLDASEEARRKIHAAKHRLPDLHESDEKYLRQVNEVAMERCRRDFRWSKIAVDRSGDLRRREEISDEILTLVLEKLQWKNDVPIKQQVLF